MMPTLGSLFDGSGGFPLSGSLCGIKPMWASEVEPYPIAVTRSRFPDMKHLGSVTDIDGAEVEPVDIITFGSPCQDLSVAGKRAGLKHEINGDDETTRSGLFMEAVRIIREMREKTDGNYPKWAVWENVPGAFSSNKGEDFRIVLEELIKIVEPNAVMPPVPKSGWPYADCYYGDGWSLAYRVLDAQFWGVPQRRRRIYLVLDLTGQRAGSVLFEREGLRRHFAESRTPWQKAAGDAADRTGTADREGALFQPMSLMEENWSESDVKNSLRAGESKVSHAVVERLVLDDQGGSQISVRTDGKSPTLRAEMHGNVPCVMEAAGFKAGQGVKARSIGWEEEKVPTLAAEAGGNSVPSVCVKCYESHPMDSRIKELDDDISPTVSVKWHKGAADTPLVVTEDAIPIHDKATRYQGGGPTRNGDGAGNGLGVGQPGAPSPTLSTCDRHMVAYSVGNGQLNQISMSETCNTLDCMHDKQAVLVPETNRVRYIVRRLTPTECARLQGFPDDWGHPVHMVEISDGDYRFWLGVRKLHAAINGKQIKDYTEEQIMNWYNKLHTDSSEYKMWGNGIALPCALYVMEGIAEELNKRRGGN